MTFKHIRCRGLLLQGFPQFAEQSCILDGDYGLICKCRNQLDLLH